MNGFGIKLSYIELKNLKNVRAGRIDIARGNEIDSASLLGIYGQNGSGKTALIDSLTVLKYLVCGRAVPDYYAGLINSGASRADIVFGFDLEDEENDIISRAEYSFSFEKKELYPYGNSPETNLDSAREIPIISSESLKLSYRAPGESHSFSEIVGVSASGVEIFTPRAKYKALVGAENEDRTALEVAKRLCRETSRSFIFSSELLSVVRKNCTLDYCLEIINALVYYANNGLFVINNKSGEIVSLDSMPIAAAYKKDGAAVIKSFNMSLNGETVIPSACFDGVCRAVENMNAVLEHIIPGLNLGVCAVDSLLLQDGGHGISAQLMSKRKGAAPIPLKYESEGIKKIISVLRLIVLMYNSAGATVAIDELDSGIFEYLLGEILRIVSEKGRGQLIFTSHNLRPLETLDRSCIVFTTTDPDNRYIRLPERKMPGNLRNFYYRDITLGENIEPIYDKTDNYDIALAIRKAGELIGL